MYKTKKILSAVLCFLILAPTIGSFSHDADAASLGTVHSFSTSQPSESGYINVDYSVPSVSDGKGEALQSDLPVKYNSRDYGLVTPVKDQGESGSCWAFAAASTAETSLIKNNGYAPDSIDLSELHLAYYTYNNAYDRLGLLKGDSTFTYDNFLKAGGSHYSTVFSLARWTGFLDESIYDEFSFDNAVPSFSVSDNQKAYGYNEVILKNALWISAKDRDEIKSKIIEYGSAIIGYYHDEEYLNTDSAAYCCIQDVDSSSPLFQSPNHEASIVGWDDSYSKNNFSSVSKPSSDGAWLVKNSWGTGFGDEGYIWLSYEDSSLLYEDACFLDFTSSKQYDYNYQHDGSTNPTSNYSDGTDPTNGGYTGGGYMANIFTAQYSDNLNAVSFVTMDTNVNYSIDIYTGLTSKTNPLSGEKSLLSSLTGKKKYAGFYTVALPESVKLTKGERFSVVVRLYKDDPEEKVILPCDVSKKLDWIEYTNNAVSNQSFFSTDKSSWINVAKINAINFRIKAFTSHLSIGESFDVDIHAREIALNKDYISLRVGNTATLDVTFTPANTTNKKVTWKSSDPNTALVSSAGRITAIKEGTAIITATSVDGGYTASCTVNVKPYSNNIDPIGSSMIQGDDLTIDEALKSQDGDRITVVGQVVYRYGSATDKGKTYIIIEDIIDGEIVGILVYDKELTFDYEEGQILRITGKFTTFKGLREIAEIKNVELIGTDETIPAQQVTISKLRSEPDKFLNEYVVISDATVNNYAATGMTTVNDSTGSIDIHNAAPYPDDVKNGDIVDVFCVFSVYDTIYQLRTGSSSCYVKYNDDNPVSTDTDSNTSKYIYFGDANCDGEIRMEDVTYIQKYIAKLVTFNEAEIKVSDVNADGIISLLDVTDIQKFIAKLLGEFKSGVSTLNPLYDSSSDIQAGDIRSKLNELLSDIERFKDSYYNNDDGYYTAESFAEFTEAYELALEIQSQQDSTTDELEYVYDRLKDAISGLEIKN